MTFRDGSYSSDPVTVFRDRWLPEAATPAVSVPKIPSAAIWPDNPTTILKSWRTEGKIQLASGWRGCERNGILVWLAALGVAGHSVEAW